MILAAGIGSRLKPWTDNHPKALVTLGGTPMLRHAINAVLKTGIHDIIINIHHKGDQILEYLENNPIEGCKIIISDESEQLLDTGGAIVKASAFIGEEPVLVYNADIFCTLDLKKLIYNHKKSSCDVTMLVSDRDSNRQLIFNSESCLKGWKNHLENKTLPEDLTIELSDKFESYNGIQVINPTAIKALSSLYHEGPFPIIPAYLKLISQIRICGFNPGKDTYNWVDIGTPEKLDRARHIFKVPDA